MDEINTSASNFIYDFIDEDVYEIEKVKEYKTNKHIFLRVKKER